MADWDYGEEKGPQKWYIKYPAAAGKRQSPIDIPIKKAVQATLPQLKGVYITDKIRQTLHNVGHGWKLVTEGENSDLSLSG
ncbi:unnamed protein product [Acanthoscelides obtectus]|uniref:Alpha-carbonic anhydrase domain-containing protein n=1 Tax=Acanthoscelides obtectus TaxID=200917 RepID=A0A9P0KQ99_ACAOB|nr:unnamed protein product [Acanthoscelides obtectus]CAH2012121.1 unnamed protein product [Acanthoscelides obtectus]CAK1669383.1 Carbonic anhydrase 1 [Acanthoscelides obtectus]CAK1669404.1 Carbonic anhydrase 1 [Acanthoscelides obtectus]